MEPQALPAPEEFSAFKPVTWRGTTNISHQRPVMGISFDEASGETIRLLLDVKSARHLSESIQEYLDAYRKRGCTCCQSASSREIPSVAGSTPDEGEKQCPPEISSAAFSGV